MRGFRECALPLFVMFALGGCPHNRHEVHRPFAEREVVWKLNDDVPFSNPPESFYSPFAWDGADNAVFRPLSEVFLLKSGRDAKTVNSMDEVPDSSWYKNRLSRFRLSPAEVAKGACSDSNDVLPTPITIVGGKPDGASPGFQIMDGEGVRYLLKTSGLVQKERPGAADTIGAIIYHAAGYHVPCNRVVNVDPKDFVLKKGAEVEYTNGSVEPLTRKTITEVMSKAMPLEGGLYRVSVSQFVDGKPISPWRYYGTREGDPNDRIPHEHRRELRAMYVLSAWTGHVDSRQENTLAVWVNATGEKGYVRHYMLDFGDCFGIVHPEWDDLNRRLNHSGYFDLGHIASDLFTFGLWTRPWDYSQSEYVDRIGVEFSYFGVERFEADKWRPGYPNNAYDEKQEADLAWMARIVARFSNEHLRAIVERGHFTRPELSEALLQILKGRRDKILERYLTKLSPLTWPEVEGLSIFFEDLALTTGIRKRSSRSYQCKVHTSDDPCQVEAAEEGAHLRLDKIRSGYHVVDVIVMSPTEQTFPLRAHVIRHGSLLRLVGLERPDTFDWRQTT